MSVDHRAPIEWWGGVECTVNRVGDRWHDQLVWSGHDRRPEDLDRFADLGLQALRYPVLWERVAPDAPDLLDWRWSDERLARLRDLRIRPIVGLVHHGSGPHYTSLLDPAFPEKLARFASEVAQRYPWLIDFTPVNEPLTTARFSALYGHWYPHERSDRAFVRALVHQARAIVTAMQAIRIVVPQARLIQTEDCGKTFGTDATASQVAHDNDRRWLTWDLLTGAVTHEHPLYGFLSNAGFSAEDEAFFRDTPCPPDIVGLNYYLTSDRYLDARLSRYPESYHGGNSEMRYADVEAVRSRPEGIAGHESHIMEAWERYGIPVALTEVHLACTRDEQLRWLMEAWTGAQTALAKGADVRAVTPWALLGSNNWDSLVTEDAGHYESGVFDVGGPIPRATAVAELVSTLASGRAATHPVLEVPGWWWRPERLLYGSASGGAVPLPSNRPLLIVGSSGTLGRAFQRVCRLRGLPARLVGRTEMDVTDPTAIDSLIRRLHPWAIVNAAGYVRVDDAEREAEICHRINAAGAANLAAACRRRGLPLVTYSSDLVFDGAKGAPYDEGDVTNPLGVYGASKRAAEERVLALLPEALIVRTGAFFGPWDEHNFLAHVFRALDRGETFLAAHDSVVSPTYVPDLVHASLDLLLDREHGIWHLANDGALSWYDFAVRAAKRSGRQTDRIAGATSSQVWGAATRPAFSALTSRRGRLMRTLDAGLDAFLDDLRNQGRVSSLCASR